MANNKRKVPKGKILGAAAGAAAVGAGAYYLLGPNKKAHQKKAKALLAKMAREAKGRIKKAKKMSLPVYNAAIDKFSTAYAKQYKAHEKDIKAFAEKLKRDWKKSTMRTVKSTVRGAKSQGKGRAKTKN